MSINSQPQRLSDPRTYWTIGLSIFAVLLSLLYMGVPVLMMSPAQRVNFPRFTFSWLVSHVPGHIKQLNKHHLTYWLYRYGNPFHGTTDPRNIDRVLIENRIAPRAYVPLYDSDPWVFFVWPFFAGVLTVAAFAGVGAYLDNTSVTQMRYPGRKIRGPDVDTRAQFNRKQLAKRQPLGIGILTANPPSVGERIVGKRSKMLWIPKKDEAHGMSFVGAPGTGKTQLIFAIVDQLDMERRY